MNAAKRSRITNALGRFSTLARSLRRAPWTLVMGIALSLLAIAGVAFAWNEFGHLVQHHAQFGLTAASIEVTPQPAWIQADVKTEVMRDGSLSGLSALDPQVTVSVARAFELHPWVARVIRVRKMYPNRVVVQLKYRRPVIMVKVAEGFWPVDAEGVLLPPDEFSPNQTRNFLRLVEVYSQPAGPVGTPYGDERVAGAAHIADLIGERWLAMGLHQIVAVAPPGRNHPADTTYELVSRGGTRIAWGHAPGRESAREATAAEKIGRLLEYVRQAGPLDQQHAPDRIDLRDPGGVARLSSGLTPTARRDYGERGTLVP